MTLPFGAKAPDVIETGHATSAPFKPMLWRKALRHNIGLNGADVACPVSMTSGAFAPNGSVIKNTHHQSKIYTTSPDTNPM